MRRREEMTVGAARSIGEVSRAVGVTREAPAPRKVRLIAVACMAALADLVLRDLVQAR
jgi:hypothetical protein